MRIGIIGLGEFGRLAAMVLVKDTALDVVACEPRDVAVPERVRKVALKQAAKADVILLCVPLAAYESVLTKLGPLLRKDTLVVDVCSVKMEPERLLRLHLPGHRNLLITHPMFGPQTAKNGIEGLTLVVAAAEGARAGQAVQYCEDVLKLKIVRMTSEEHDRQMAGVHALTFFIARGLTDFGVQPGAFDPPSFKSLLGLSALDKVHSEELFRTMEVGNPYARGAREKFIKTLERINNELEGTKP